LFDDKEIKYLNLDTEFEEAKYQTIGLKICDSDQKVSHMISGSNSNIIVIDIKMLNN
jgi:hypothetical protein